MPAVLVAAPAAAPPPEPAKHSWITSLAYHFLPGLAPLACIYLFGPVMKAWGLPPAMALYLGALLGVLPVQLGILYFLGYKRNGRLTLDGIVLLRERVPGGQLLLLVLGCFLWSGLAFGLVGGYLNGLLQPLFDWMPPIFRATTEGWETLTTGLGLTLLGIATISTVIAAPVVEELYFRGFLLPRLPVAAAWVPLVGAVLFAVYHFWSPWMIPVRIIMLTPLLFAVHKKRSIWISIITHCLLNLVDPISMLPLVLQ